MIVPYPRKPARIVPKVPFALGHSLRLSHRWLTTTVRAYYRALASVFFSSFPHCFLQGLRWDLVVELLVPIYHHYVGDESMRAREMLSTKKNKKTMPLNMCRLTVACVDTKSFNLLIWMGFPPASFTPSTSVTMSTCLRSLLSTTPCNLMNFSAVGPKSPPNFVEMGPQVSEDTQN